jgi:cytochrome c oxidase subunit IV
MEHDITHPDAAAATAHEESHHPQWSTYWKVALILGLITVGEVWMYYVPAIVASRAFVPGLLTLSALKFAIVVMFYMHLKYDHRLFRALFTGPLLIAASLLIALMFLFGHLAAKL